MTENPFEENPFYKNWSELIQPNRLEVDRESHTESYGKFACQPLERGFATTIGNSLRRILLSSIQGAAITSVRIEGALHEFTAIPGILEDVTEIILNLKEVRLRLNSAEGKTVRISKKDKGPVTAADIISDGSVEVMNPEKHICTITGKGKFEAELEVKWGKGYRPAELNKTEEQPIGVIPIDSVFTPVKKVKYIVTQARVGQQTDYDKLTLEIHTDGSVKPENALAYAAKILKEHMTIFINFDEDKAEPEIEETEEKTDDRKLEHSDLLSYFNIIADEKKENKEDSKNTDFSELDELVRDVGEKISLQENEYRRNAEKETYLDDFSPEKESIENENTAENGITTEEQEKRRQTMMKVCNSCHSESWVLGQFKRLDNTIKTTNKMTLTATKILLKAWETGAAAGLAQKDSIFNETIEKMWIEQWLFYSNTTRFASAMIGADYGVFASGRWNMSKNIQAMKDWLYFKIHKAPMCKKKGCSGKCPGKK